MTRAEAKELMRQRASEIRAEEAARLRKIELDPNSAGPHVPPNPRPGEPSPHDRP